LDHILACALCPNMCRFDCPVLRAEEKETVSPAAKMRLAYLTETGRLDWSEEVVDLMSKCAGCNACQYWCPMDISVAELLQGVREDIVEKGLASTGIKDFVQRVKEYHNVYKPGLEKKFAEFVKEKAKVLYFVGCTTSYRKPEVAEANIEIFKKAGVNFSTFPEEWCCGSPLKILGFTKEAKEFARHNAEIIKQSKAKILVCGCPQCTLAFKQWYPEMGIKLGVEVLHTSEFFLRLIKEGKLKPTKTVPREIVYHDPCILARKLNIYEQPRELIKRIPGLELKEPQFNRQETHCCGGGGMLRLSHYKIAAEIARGRREELESVFTGGVDAIVSMCSSCEVVLERATTTSKKEVIDISRLLLKGLG